MVKSRAGRPSKKSMGNALEQQIAAGTRNLSKYFGLAVKNNRSRLGLTQEKLAAKADISLGMVAKIESGATGVRFPLIIKLAFAMGIDPPDLFDPSMRRGKVSQGKLKQLMISLEGLTEAELDWAYDLFAIALKATGKSGPLTVGDKVKQSKG